MGNVKLLDCTLRDGGYYTNWDFDKDLVRIYFESFNQLPVEYLEIGYRSSPLNSYFGEYFYCPEYVMEEAKTLSSKKLAVILNEKDVRAEHVEELLSPCKGLIDMVRIAVNPDNLGRAIGLAEEVKRMGFEVCFNVMYMSSWLDRKEFLDELSNINGIVDFFYMVDSYGGVFPDEVKATYNAVREKTSVKIGFHGHNNLELGLVNTLTAMECGVDIVDATVTGMGRGAGNLKTELLLTALNARDGLGVDFNSLSDVVAVFEALRSRHGWGTNLPYMVSGANSLPQKEVMEWVTQRFYSFNSIIRALQNQKSGLQDNEELKIFASERKYRQVLIIGGGPNAIGHCKAVHQFVQRQSDICIIHASSKNAKAYTDIDVDQYFCLVGSEGHRLEKIFADLGKFEGACILPPYPRKMGTYIPGEVKEHTYELGKIEFTDKLQDTHTALALQSALELGAEEVLVVGYDGYQDSTLTQLERNLSDENEYLFASFREKSGASIRAITPTNYKNIPVESVYAYLV